MQAITSTATDSPAILNHDLKPHFAALSNFESTAAVKKSKLYRRLQPDVERILNSVVGENFATSVLEPAQKVRAVAWNIERGNQLNGIVSALKNHPVLSAADLLLLTELDYGMARSGNVFVAREIAQQLKLNYVFAPCYLALNKGSGVEAFVEGENKQAIHGLGLFSRYPIRRAHILPFPTGKDLMSGKEKRLGSLRALIADVAHPMGDFRAVCLHLDAHSSRRHRARQMTVVLEHLEKLEPQLPVIIGGDWNTTTHNAQNAPRAILGYARRVMMGVHNVAANHYPTPDRFFERDLFAELENRGFSYKEFNESGAGTLHYDMESLATNTMLADWVPGWCFPFIFWATKRVGGKVSLRLDWFAGKNIQIAPNSRPLVVSSFRGDAEPALSDHDAIVLDFMPVK